MMTDEKNHHLLIQHFNRQAHDWELKLQINGSMEERPRQFVDLLCAHVPRGGLILDFGCGSGDITYAVKLAGFNVCGVDRSSEMIDQARRRFAGIGIRFDKLPIEYPDVLPYESGGFDAVLASSVFEYVRQPEAALRELRRVCHGKGILIMTVPDMRAPRRWIESAARPLIALAMSSKVARLSLFGEYLRLSRNRFSGKEWIEMLAIAGWMPSTVKRERSTLMTLLGRACESPIILSRRD